MKDKLTLKEFVQQVFVIAHKENTSLLENELLSQGFPAETIRGPYSDDHINFSPSMKCLVNHANAWKRAVDIKGMVMIVEADFVPVQRLGAQISPFPKEIMFDSLLYLYCCGPQLWSCVSPVVARGHGGSTVAYIISPATARLMLEYYELLIRTNPLGVYHTWDSEIGYWLKVRGVESYIPVKMYGEHGGAWNREHSNHGFKRPHRADVLQGPLSFRPQYCKDKMDCRKQRIINYFYGMGRLLSGRMASRSDLFRGRDWPLLQFCIRRFLL